MTQSQQIKSAIEPYKSELDALVKQYKAIIDATIQKQ